MTSLLTTQIVTSLRSSWPTSWNNSRRLKRRYALAVARFLSACREHPASLTRSIASRITLSFATATATATAPAPVAPSPAHVVRSCPAGMILVDHAFCIDKYEAYVVVVDPISGRETPHSPYSPVDGLKVRAKVAPDVVPQAYISQAQSAVACANAKKRLCAREEFLLACRGFDDTSLYPYGGTKKKAGYCNEGKGSSVARAYGMDSSKWTYAEFNDPALNQASGGLARTGQYHRCASPYGVYDLVGNLHEWGADAPDEKGHGRFRGGFYGDAEVNGHGCLYVTKAHEPSYHDYSTGFRCCADASVAGIDAGAHSRDGYESDGGR